ncbi:MAG TPA: 16S rRNA (adenine(1518)-N(6)/adenine(1519)-N(6))-dimethyltransferase RsmA [Candidatus Bilamarchaeum sp.]|nr:16S rRNA (adenine(1518)-N(6)/adenine(1519)-N(6))-dimethyltransferase RsmA [Candidatus Bilamarchaeum sp.]
MTTFYRRIRPSGRPKPGTGDPERKKSLGQSFLEDKNILALEARLAEPEGKRVLEIGPGDGRLTEALLALKPEKIIAVEKDARFASLLRGKFSGRPVEIVEADFLEMEPLTVDVVAGNIPYYISSDIVFRLRDFGFAHAILMVQKEFAEKMAAPPGNRNYGRLSVTSQLAFTVEKVRPVLRHLFRPAPKVDSMIIRLTKTGFRPSALEENVIRYIFQHKNKTVRNALLDSKMFAKEELSALGKYEKRRGVGLSKEECLVIARLLEKA